MRTKQYKDEDKGGYTINVESFDIEDELERPRIMEDNNESLLTMGLQYNDTKSHDNDMSMENSKEVILNADGTDISTFTTYQPSQMDEHILDVLSRYNFFPVEILSLL